MAAWSLKNLFGGKEPPKKNKPVAKTYNAPSDRAAISAEAMTIYRRERAHAQGVLEDTLKSLLAKPLKTSDIAAMTRLLSLRQALLSMKGHMGGDGRLKVLDGVRGLLGTKPESSPAVKPARRQGPSQGTKR